MSLKPNKDGYFRFNVRYEGKSYPVRSKSEKELWKKVAIKEQQLKNGQIVTNGNTTVEKWMLDYIATYKAPSVSDKTLHQLRSYVKNYISPAIGSMRMKDVRPVDLQRVLNSCAGQSLSHANKLRNLICGAFRMARRNRILLDDPSEGIQMPDTEDGTHRPITPAERKAILQVAETHRGGLWVLIMLYCGLRPTETRALTWDNVDFQRGILYVQSAKNDYGVRRVPIPNALLLRLEAAHRVSTAEHVLVQPTTGKPHTVTSMRQMWESFKEAVDDALGAEYKLDENGERELHYRKPIKIKSVIASDLTPYCLRHTYGTDMQTAGVPINITKEFMGHKDIKVTARIYTHLSDEAFATAATRINNLHDSENVIPLKIAE